MQAAAYIYRKLRQENLLEKAFNWNLAEGTDKFPLVSTLAGGTLTCFLVQILLIYNLK